MIMVVTLGEFKRQFTEHGKENHFSEYGKEALYYDLNKWVEEYILDILDLCVNYTEYENWQAYKDKHEENATTIEKEVESTEINLLLAELDQYTEVIKIDGECGFIIRNF